MENYSVQVPPYTVGPEAYRQIEKQCHIYGKKAVVVGGKKAMAAAKDKLLAAVKDTGIEILDFVWFGGECTFNNAKKLEQLEAVRQADMIFAVGGGKAIDTCKLVSIDFEKPYFSFPTIASNCAPTSAVSIVYNEDGTFCKFVHFLEPAKHVFINTEIIANAPKEYLWAGIGDTYAKYYEVSISARGEKLEHFKAMGVQLSRMCMEAMVEHGFPCLWQENIRWIITVELHTLSSTAFVICQDSMKTICMALLSVLVYCYYLRLMEKRKNARSLSHLIRQWAFQQSFLKWV